MSHAIRARRLSTAEVRRIILATGPTLRREPSLGELFSILIYRADENTLPITKDPQDTRRLNPDAYSSYAGFFTKPRLLRMLKACQEGKAPPGAHAAFQLELNKSIAGLFVLAIGEWKRVGGWLKTLIVECFEPAATEKHLKSCSSKNYPILQEELSFKRLLKIPLINPDPKTKDTD
jgi:hypothetical protein